MNVLTVFAHPDPQSFCGAVRERFVAGLKEGGQEVDVADLYAEHFDPVFRTDDKAFYADESVPEFVLQRMRLKDKVIQHAGGPLRRLIARQWVRGKTDKQVAKAVV